MTLTLIWIEHRFAWKLLAFLTTFHVKQGFNLK